MSCKLNNLEESSKEVSTYEHREKLKTLVSLREAIFLPKFTSFILSSNSVLQRNNLYTFHFSPIRKIVDVFENTFSFNGLVSWHCVCFYQVLIIIIKQNLLMIFKLYYY